ncbi:hypothetical protein SAMN05216228_1008114 [Rhizobium tibeticum]|uniref:Periplasmic glucans biosynthesis protein n=1 Tax=Rhizobium tibeticum TaxID=501024 RepID=A0A1H8JYQ6_9HYPH|nr:Periplasmic glucans biosynthesis protein [Rhizobium tibeticum]SEN85894.1 hypothetical protein SAMN05216228_1008114 [Rhizobium tibeticum]
MAEAMSCTHSPTDRLNAAARCHATSKRSGFQCQAPAVRGKKVCRMHGARAGAPSGERNGNYRHGGHTNETRTLVAKARLLKVISRKLLQALSD